MISVSKTLVYTSSNSIVRELIENADDAAKSDIENLISGGSKIHEDITYDDIHKTIPKNYTRHQYIVKLRIFNN